jgi:hypothetical protein
MPEENTVDFAALCEELSARVESLETQLAEEQDKNAVLVPATWGQTRLTIADRNVRATFLADRGDRQGILAMWEQTDWQLF